MPDHQIIVQIALVPEELGVINCSTVLGSGFPLLFAGQLYNGVTLPVDGGAWAASGWVRARNGKWTLNEGLSLGG